MKVCISSTGNNLDSPVDPRFGRCPFFLIIDTETNQFETIANPGANFGGGAGIAAAQTMASQHIEVVISGNVGPNAFGVLKNAGIKMFTGVFKVSARQALEDFKNNKLKESIQPTGPNFMGRPDSGTLGNWGQGRGRFGRKGR
jgi:predicted Fe-Mo cluster-binding NifX family protein